MKMSRRFWGAIFCGAILLCLQTPQAQAHGDLVSATPAPDEILSIFPTSISLVFTEKLQEIGSNKINVILVLHANGSQVATKNTTVANEKLTTELEPQTEPGTYTVMWRNVSVDGHASEGKYDFTYQSTSAAPSTKTDVVSEEPSGKKTNSTYIFLGLFFLIAVGIYLFFKFQKSNP